MTNILHSTTKYDGSIHYIFEAQTIYIDENYLLIYKEQGTKLTSYRGVHHPPSHMLALYEKNRFHNVSVHWHKDWTPRFHYVNIATPASWIDGTLRWIDMDLDIIREYGNEKPFVDDEDEFELHRKKFSYPNNLIERCRKETEEVLALMDRRQGFYSDEAFNWRPGKEISSFLPVKSTSV